MASQNCPSVKPYKNVWLFCFHSNFATILCASTISCVSFLDLFGLIVGAITGADPRMVRIGTAPPFWQINHANSTYFRLFWGCFQVISAIRPPPFGSRPYISWIRPWINPIMKSLLWRITDRYIYLEVYCIAEYSWWVNFLAIVQICVCYIRCTHWSQDCLVSH